MAAFMNYTGAHWGTETRSRRN